jgi:hypothetical protein
MAGEIGQISAPPQSVDERDFIFDDLWQLAVNPAHAMKSKLLLRMLSPR